ncbi:transposase [Candidatus Peregrinibacteria bacterium]|nr:transposase [Candidatus Peregrinibacteria bacterium]
MTQRHWIQNGHMMFVTANTLHRRLTFKDPAKARLAVESIYQTQTRFPFFLFSFVVMPDHCHILLSVPDNGSISRIMHDYKRSVSFQLGEGPIWQPRFDCQLVRNFHDVIPYIHANPVKAGLCEEVKDYLWSSASGKWDVIALDFMGGF